MLWCSYSVYVYLLLCYDAATLVLTCFLPRINKCYYYYHYYYYYYYASYVWKIFTGILSDKLFYHPITERLLSHEQKGCHEGRKWRKWSNPTLKLMLIGSTYPRTMVEGEWLVLKIMCVETETESPKKHVESRSERLLHALEGEGILGGEEKRKTRKEALKARNKKFT